MKTLLPLVALVALCAPALGAQQDVRADLQTRMLRLKSGAILWGSIESHAPDGIRFRILETGGVVPLGWSLLDPAEEHELRLSFGYVEAGGEELLVDAERITLNDGTELIGKIVNTDDQYLWFKRAEGTIPIDKRRLEGGAVLVRAPALDVYTKEELYQLKAFEVQGELLLEGTRGARAHDQLAQFAERLFDFAHAVEHYGTARLLDPDYDAERVQMALERSSAKAELKQQIDLLAEIDVWRVRKRYDKALEGLESFPKLYPGSPLLEEWNDLRERVKRHQEADLGEEVVRRFHAWSVRLVRDAARKKSYEEVLAYLDEGLTEDLLKNVLQDLNAFAPDITPEEMQRIWRQRQGGRFHQASYGLGTWLLGEERALATPGGEKDEEQEAEKPAAGSQAAARAKLEERIQRYLKNQELARKAQDVEGTSKEEDPSEFWDDLNHASRAQWILAYFVENSGLFEIERIRFANCRECGGTGARDVINTGSAIAGDTAGSVLMPCPTCHTIGRVRRVRYR